ncbi:SsrA-binding protein [Sporolactobacillus spathodeae]|uniref:SsrA-binding protein n=2 Tax=Sporolactobacillus spathodeae TaxID=1465502 RepID=A0ABS2Q5V8_9BACL|nr:SsrA-binding protein [Sporolactobacillus spathodeae]
MGSARGKRTHSNKRLKVTADFNKAYQKKQQSMNWTNGQVKQLTNKEAGRVLAQNRKASHDYFIEETVEAGLVLQGTEIKSIRRGKVNIQDAFARIESGEAYLYNMHISTYEQGNRYNHEPLRTRKLLLHQKEINKLGAEAGKPGYALIPLKVYVKNGFAKVLVGLGRGKKMFDKRETLKKQTAEREMARAFRQRQ